MIFKSLCPESPFPGKGFFSSKKIDLSAIMSTFLRTFTPLWNREKISRYDGFMKGYFMEEKKKVVVAMSGGVDSTLTARLLQEAGYDVYGATMHIFNGQDLGDAADMARFLKIPHKVIDVRDIYQKEVMSYFIRSYKNGITPNPCMVCDFKIKFGLFYDAAREYFDAPYFATGHYARITYDSTRGKYQVEKGTDLGKDQSYMMYQLTQEKLAHIIFPLGRIFKKDTRRLSEEKGLPTYNKAESQDICFLTTEKSYADYLEIHAPDAFRPGNIVTKTGKILGHHKGLPHYTIGQRKGLGIAAKHPLYVVSLDARKNEVVVGSNDDLFRTRLLAGDLAFTDGKPPSTQFRCSAKIRYGIRVHDCTVTLDDYGRATVKFDEPQRAVTSGQSVVFYDENRLIGGGTIIKPL